MKTARSQLRSCEPAGQAWGAGCALQAQSKAGFDRIRVLSGLVAMALLAGPACGDDPRTAAETLFVRRIAPLLQEKCLACHGAEMDKLQGGLDLRTQAALLTGGDSQLPVVVAGQPDESPLLQAIVRTDENYSPMPPKEAERLTPEQVGWFRSWIEGGAPWPDAARSAAIRKTYADLWSAEDGVSVPTSGGLSADWTQRRYKIEGLWAYQPVSKPAVDPSAGSAIDVLIGRRMPAGVEVAPPADRTTLLRRATFDLTGLPPAPEEVEAFVRDPQSDALAFSDVVDRLLASPHYGERMAQHWLDVVRYADSSGFANDYERGNAWRYRDYVVRSFNDDKPYDRFIREQIAGDEAHPEDPEALIATGFLRMGPWELTGMEVARVARQRFLDDVTNSVGETFLAHSLQCARCHDHKFDPVPTRDYYAVQAVFATTQLVERPAPFLPIENVGGFDERKFLERRREGHLQVLRDLDRKLLAAADAWFAEHAIDPEPWNAAVDAARGKGSGGRREGAGVFNAARMALLAKQIPEEQFPPKFLGFTPTDYGNERVARKGLERLKWELERYEPVALAVYGGRTPKLTSVTAPLRLPERRMTEGELESACILIGGDPFASGPPVSPGVLSVLGSVWPDPLPEGIEGRRKAFADWVARPDNPLTTRTIVNRVWGWHFDRPLAGNPNNFGSTGKRPTHPELLDWLAATLVEQGWSIKALHRYILNTETYRRSSEHPDPALLAQHDPAGTSHAVFHPRPLSAEELRDALLSVTGELNRTLGGIPNRPEINLEAALQPRQVMGTFASAWTPNPLPAQRHRRSLYALKLRGLRDPFLEVFNVPGPDFSCERREASTVTPQVFSLFNGRASHDRALALAHRALRETDSEEAALRRCFQLAYGRSATPREVSRCLAHWNDFETLQAARQPRRAGPPLEVLREAVEENTGERFTFRETLHGAEEFVADLQAADVDIHTRALADLCLALINANEFAYVY